MECIKPLQKSRCHPDDAQVLRDYLEGMQGREDIPFAGRCLFPTPRRKPDALQVQEQAIYAAHARLQSPAAWLPQNDARGCP